VISHEAFSRLRLRSFVGDVTDLVNWQFMGKSWVGEAVGFTEWLCPEEDPGQLGSVSLDLTDLPAHAVASILERLEVPVRPGMSLDEVTQVLGAHVGQQELVPGRCSYDFAVDAPSAYHISCTIHEDDGLIYLVVAPVGMSEM
jgi:hypothetical protein